MPSWQNYVKRYNDDSIFLFFDFVFDIRGNKYRLVVVVKFTTIINRATLTIFCPWALQGIQEAVKAASWPQ